MEFADDFTALRDSVVFIDAGSSTGSGVLISGNEILTAEHVVSGKGGVNVSVRGVGLVFASVRGYDTDRDIALLTFTDGEADAVATLAEDAWTGSEWQYGARLGSEVAVIGYVSGISETTPIATFGRVGVRWSIVPGDISKLQIDAPVTGGMSGGGVFNRRGELVGILLSRSIDFAGNVRALDYTEIDEVLADLRSGVKR